MIAGARDPRPRGLVRRQYEKHVRFTPNSDRESEFPHKVMSALPPKADMCGTQALLCFGPEAAIGPTSDEYSNARQDNSDLGEFARLRIDFD
jgi:hypothetical protein